MQRIFLVNRNRLVERRVKINERDESGEDLLREPREEADVSAAFKRRHDKRNDDQPQADKKSRIQKVESLTLAKSHESFVEENKWASCADNDQRLTAHSVKNHSDEACRQESLRYSDVASGEVA